MNYLKKMALALALIAGLCGGAWAQDRGHHDAERRVDRHWVYQYRNGHWGYFPYRTWGSYYPYTTYSYYPYNYGYYPYGAYGYYPNSGYYGTYGYYPYGRYYPYRNWGTWDHYPNRAWDHGRDGWHGGVREHGHERR